MGSSLIKPLKETGEHSYHRRAFAHDYHAPFIYHIILKKAAGCEIFGSIEGDARIAPGNPGCAKIRESELGKTIAKSILHLPYEHPVIKIYQYCVMPDHVHLLLQILFRTDRHLDFYIDGLKAKIADRYSKQRKLRIDDNLIFEIGYCDKPLYDNRSLDGLFRYVRENPHRLAMRRQFPRFFQRIRKLKIGAEEYEAYGNLFLFRNPDKEAVRISRKFTPEEKHEKIAGWLAGAERGAVLVSPFISKEEKAVRAEAEALGAKIILIAHEAFPERYKPAARDFALCAAGKLLIVSLGRPPQSDLSRAVCLRMNALAEALASAR